MSKKIFAMFLAIVLVLGTLPVLAISSAAEATKTNVALGKTATAGNGNTFASITDGATSELADIGYWTKDGSTTEAAGLDGTCYVEIDLGENFDVYELRVVNYVDCNQEIISGKPMPPPIILWLSQNGPRSAKRPTRPFPRQKARPWLLMPPPCGTSGCTEPSTAPM